jgi:hypothetical protein
MWMVFLGYMLIWAAVRLQDYARPICLRYLFGILDWVFWIQAGLIVAGVLIIKSQ